jgi:hypothetical protein
MYQKLPIGTHQPGLLIISIDQSQSMTDPYEGTSKQDFAALAANRCIYEIMNACRSGEIIKDRCHIGVIGYGQNTDLLLGGRPSELEKEKKRMQVLKKKVPDGAGGLVEIEQKLPIYIEPQAENGTPMEKGFDLVGDLAEAWISENPNNFPPVVINITDGEPNDASKTERSAQRLLNLRTSDGNLLLLNAHIAVSAGQQIALPSNENGLPNEYARLLFRISSVLPEPMVNAARNAGFAPDPGARGFVMNAGAENLTKLLVFGSAFAR